jgi:hypothetical protein
VAKRRYEAGLSPQPDCASVRIGASHSRDNPLGKGLGWLLYNSVQSASIEQRRLAAIIVTDRTVPNPLAGRNEGMTFGALVSLRSLTSPPEMSP